MNGMMVSSATSPEMRGIHVNMAGKTVETFELHQSHTAPPPHNPITLPPPRDGKKAPHKNKTRGLSEFLAGSRVTSLEASTWLDYNHADMMNQPVDDAKMAYERVMCQTQGFSDVLLTHTRRPASRWHIKNERKQVAESDRKRGAAQLHQRHMAATHLGFSATMPAVTGLRRDPMMESTSTSSIDCKRAEAIMMRSSVWGASTETSHWPLPKESRFDLDKRYPLDRGSFSTGRGYHEGNNKGDVAKKVGLGKSSGSYGIELMNGLGVGSSRIRAGQAGIDGFQKRSLERVTAWRHLTLTLTLTLTLIPILLVMLIISST